MSHNSQGIIDGEPAAIEGKITVNEPADGADQTVEHAESTVGAYLWRATYPDSGINTIDFESREIRGARAPFASGLEAGEFSVDSGTRMIRIDPTWFLETYDSTRLSELDVSGPHSQMQIAISLWESPTIDLAATKTTRTLNQISELINMHDVKDLNEYQLEAKPIWEGSTFAVAGSVRLEQGEPVICGTEATPLVLSDQGFDALRKNLRTKMIKHGVAAVVCLTLIAAVWHYL